MFIEITFSGVGNIYDLRPLLFFFTLFRMILTTGNDCKNTEGMGPIE